MDRDTSALPPNLATVLRVVQILLTYGRHLADTFTRRSISPGFHIIARPFGTSRPAIILAHIRRGILRAAALEHVLLRRAARGRDLTIPPVRVRIKPEAPQPVPEDPAAQPAAEPPEAPPRRKSPPRASWRDDWLDGAEDVLDPCHLPSFEELVAQARHRSIGRSIGDICADLGVAPVLCSVPFWNELFMTIMYYGGSPAIYGVRRWRREAAFEREQDSLPTLNLSWPKVEVGGGRGHILQVLGFLIGEAPVEPPLIMLTGEAPQHAETAPAGPAPLRPQAEWVTPPKRRPQSAPAAAPAARGPP